MKIYVWGTGCGAGDLLDRGLDPREVCGFLDGEGRDGSFLGRPIMAPDALRRCCEAVGTSAGGRCAVFAGDDGAGWKYALRLPGGDLKRFVSAMNAALRGRGGGKDGFAQGSVSAGRAEIEAWFKAL